METWKEYQLFNMNFRTKVRSNESRLRVVYTTVSLSEMQKRATSDLENKFRVLSLLNTPTSSKPV